MNTKITALTLAAATAFAFTPKPAVAGHNDGAVIAGAIIGGLIIGAAIASADNCPPAQVYVSGPVYAPAPVYVAGGYWTTAPVNVWVAPTWIVTTDHYGRSNRRYVAGHYECRNERRWVAHNRYDNRGGHNNREVARGYGNNDRRDDHRNDRHDDRRDNGRNHR